MVDASYGTVQYDRLCEQVARQVQEMIVTGQLQEGSQLAPERELAEKFGVSRTVIREAIKLLSERGLVEVVPGKGTFVKRLSTEAVSVYMGLLVKLHGASLMQFHEVRTALEVAAAGYAAARVRPDKLEALRELVEILEDCLSRQAKEDFITYDVKFHTMVADMTENPLFQVVLEPVSGALADMRRLTWDITDSPYRGQNYHRLLLGALERNDVPAAREAMWKHMMQVEEDIRAVQNRMDEQRQPNQP